MDIHVEIAAETLFHVGPVPVTNSMLTMFIIMGLLIFSGWLVARNLQEVPGRLQGLVEMIVGFILDLVDGTAGKKAGRPLVPLVGAMFIFILFANYSGLLPGVGTVGLKREEESEAVHEATTGAEHEEGYIPVEIASVGAVGSGVKALSADEAESAKEPHTVLVPFLRAPNADINMTLALALITFTTVQFLGIRSQGFRGRFKHMANPPFLFPIELVSEFSRIISLSARLFGNVFAGEVLMGVMVAMANAIKIAIIPLALPVVFLFVELLFGTIQALVFALLTTIYITLATAGHDDHEQEEEEHAIAHGQPQVAGSHGD